MGHATPYLRLTLAALALGLLTGLLAPAAANAEVKRVILDQQSTNGRFSVSPDKVEQDVTPGETAHVTMSLTNYIDAPVEIEVTPVDLAPARNSAQLVEIVKQSDFGAGSWMTPELTTATLKPLEQVQFDVAVKVPADAPPGTNFGGLTVLVHSSTGTNEVSAGSTKVGFQFQGLAQMYFNVAGAVKHDIKVAHTDIGSSFIIGGRRLVTYEVTFQNDGTVNEHISGSVLVKSLFGNTTKRLPLPKGLLVLRGSKRTWRLVWDGTPRFGRFTAQGRFHSDTKDLTASFPSVVILPPWWWLLLILLVLLIPVARWVYERQYGWKKYMDEDWDDEEDWDEDWDDITT